MDRTVRKLIELVKNRSNNTVRSYVNDAELLYRFTTTGKLGQRQVKTPLIESSFDWAAFTEEMAVEYVRELKKTAADTSIARKIYALRQFFKFLRKKERRRRAILWGDMELHAIRRKLPVTLTINEMNQLLSRIREPIPALLGVPIQKPS